MMKLTFALLALLATAYSFAQMSTIGKVYIVEGVVADRESLKVIPSAVLYNDTLGVTTTSDENGYFKIVVPFEMVKSNKNVLIRVVKSGYKSTVSGFGFNPVPLDTISVPTDTNVVYHFGLDAYYMAKNNSALSSSSGTFAPSKQGVHGAAMVQLSFKELVLSDLQELQIDKLKEGNDKVYFPLDGAIGLATNLYDIIAVGKLTHVYLDGKKIKITDINKLVNRSAVYYDGKESEALYKMNGKETIALRTTPPPGVDINKSNRPKAVLTIEVGD